MVLLIWCLGLSNLHVKQEYFNSGTWMKSLAHEVKMTLHKKKQQKRKFSVLHIWSEGLLCMILGSLKEKREIADAFLLFAVKGWRCLPWSLCFRLCKQNTWINSIHLLFSYCKSCLNYDKAMQFHWDFINIHVSQGNRYTFNFEHSFWWCFDKNTEKLINSMM